MLSTTEELTNDDGGLRVGGRKRLLGRCIVGAAATILIVTGLAWNARGSSERTASMVATATPAAAATPAFCPAARAYVNNLPLIQTSLTNPSTLPSLLLSVAPGIGASISSAPADVQADMGTLNKAIGDFQTALGTASNQLSKLPPQQAISLQSPTVSQAIAHLLRYINTTCG